MWEISDFYCPKRLKEKLSIDAVIDIFWPGRLLGDTPDSSSLYVTVPIKGDGPLEGNGPNRRQREGGLYLYRHVRLYSPLTGLTCNKLFFKSFGLCARFRWTQNMTARKRDNSVAQQWAPNPLDTGESSCHHGRERASIASGYRSVTFSLAFLLCPSARKSTDLSFCGCIICREGGRMKGRSLGVK